jgi:hypothetical protein
MGADPTTLDFDRLFRDRHMFDSADDWAAAGFRLHRASENKICVASHSSVDGLLFKKYVDAGKRRDPADQLANYERRVEGSRRIRSLIDDQHLRHVAVPKKWIRPLPSRFGKDAHVLVVERLDLLGDDETERHYSSIDEDVLRDLCVVLHAFRGLDSTAKNVPFTSRGQVAFIDTEHWDRHAGRKKQRAFLKYIGEHLSSDRWKLAKKMWDKLDGDDA